jgi:divalent metal cation (Fe/Co/Zn/Cd) transporter
MVLAGVSLVVMPVLGTAKRRLARRMGSRALAADGMETLLCAYLSFTLLLGLSLNAWLGWWWADPVAALAMVGFMLREGWEAFEVEAE